MRWRHRAGFAGRWAQVALAGLRLVALRGSLMWAVTAISLSARGMREAQGHGEMSGFMYIPAPARALSACVEGMAPVFCMQFDFLAKPLRIPKGPGHHLGASAKSVKIDGPPLTAIPRIVGHGDLAKWLKVS